MSSNLSPVELIEGAFQALSERPGFVERSDQRQLALLLSDLIAEGTTGAFEAPTGLGKSLATLIPAIAHGIASGRRTVIATYTNVLAEQYWRKDLPIAKSLFSEDLYFRSQLLMGRARYLCLLALEEHAPDQSDALRMLLEMGTENEFRNTIRKPAREITQLWQKVTAPPVCPGRMCPAYDDCYYFDARRKSEKAHVVITNHSVVIQDALMKRAVDDGDGLLGKYDFLILDEAHDFPQAAINGLEFELSGPKLSALLGVAGRLESSLIPLAIEMGEEADLRQNGGQFRDAIERAQKDLGAFGSLLHRPGILDVSPAEVLEHPQVKSHRASAEEGAQHLANGVSEACRRYVSTIEEQLTDWKGYAGDSARKAADSVRAYTGYLREYGIGAENVFEPQGVAVSYVGGNPNGVIVRQDVIDLVGPLRELIWEKSSYACLSATLALDGTFDFFKRTTGAEPQFEEVLPTPFDFSSQAALYMPPPNRIPDPTIARREGFEHEYLRALAQELSAIIEACQGRTLALFHSRKEMEGVFMQMNLPPELPIYMQPKFGAATIGDRFKANVGSSMFALRSFWTGFDAPGETLSCVVLVRVPFEVPIDPPQIARLAYLQTQGRDAFFEHSLPNAKMLMRQGAGRLIRTAEDKGIIAILDPRVQTKRYGEDILGNLPPEMRLFRDIADAVGHIGLGE